MLGLPSEGLRSLTYFVTLGSGDRLVLRCVEGRDDTAWLSLACRTFEERGLPAPRVVHVDSTFSTRWRWGWAAFTEQYIAGKPASGELSGAELAAMGHAYARVHQVSSERWGKPHRPRRGDLIAEWVRWAMELGVEAAGSAPPELGDRLERLAREIARDRPSAPARHELCHNRVTPTNVLITEKPECFLIDLERVKYGSALSELASIEADVLARNPGAFQAFLEGYGTVRERPRPDDPAWKWHRKLVRLKRARDAALRDDLNSVRSELEDL